MTDPTIFGDFADDLDRDRNGGNSSFGTHLTAGGGGVRDEAWVEATFGDVGPAPSNEVEVDQGAPEAPNVERPCEGEVTDD